MKKLSIAFVLFFLLNIGQNAKASYTIMGGLFDCSCVGSNCTVLCGGSPNEACISIIINPDGNGGMIKVNGECSHAIHANPVGNPLEDSFVDKGKNTTVIGTVKNINGNVIGTRVRILEQLPSFDDFKIAPNPVQNKELKISFTADADQDISVFVQDIITQKTIQKQIHASRGGNTETIQLDNDFHGMGILRMQTDGKVLTESIMVQ